MQGNSFRVTTGIVVVVFLIALIGIIAWGLNSTEKRTPVADSIKPSGHIYLSLIPNDHAVPQRIYTFDTQTKSLTPFTGEFDSADSSIGGMTNSAFSSSGDKIAFAANSTESPKFFQIFVMNRDGGQPRQVTNSSSMKSDPDWSPDGSKIAFIARLPKSALGATTTESYGAYITDLQGNEQFITEGTYPKFSPDGKSLLVLKDDGLYRAELAPSKGGDVSLSKVWSINNGNTYLGMKLGISHNRDMLAWGAPNVGRIIVYDIASWNPFQMSIKDEISSNSFWPVFSPDGNFLAAQEVDWGDPNTNQRLVIYNFQTKKKETVFDLGDYDQTAMWVNDWQ